MFYLEKNLATGIGSLPYQEAKQAVDFILSCFKDDVLFWPQLPKKSFLEQMMVQFSEKLPGVVIDQKNKNIFVDTKNDSFGREAEECFQNYLDGNLDYFAVSPEYASGLYALCDKLNRDTSHFSKENTSSGKWDVSLIKGQIVGPITFGMNLLDIDKQPIIYHPELKECLIKLLSMKARWQIEKLAGDRGQGAGDRKIIIFIDEPYLSCSGSSFFTLKKEDVIEKLNELIDAVHSEDALCGIHCCGNTDWSMILSTNLDILSFDAYGYLDNLLLYSEALDNFLARDGILSFGIVPNNEEALEKGKKEELAVRLKKVIGGRRGVGKVLITSSCGCGTLEIKLSEAINHLCVEIVKELG
ncbi:MAG: hypothetical protein AABY43_03355 [Candidatus Omnitrophota bacterium]